MKQVFVIPGYLPTTRHLSNKLSIDVAARKIDRALKDIKPMREPVIMNITWVEATQERNRDEIKTGAAFLLDGLVRNGIVTGAGLKSVPQIRSNFALNLTHPRVIVELEEVKSE